MVGAQAPATVEELQQKLDKLRRRQRRNERAEWASGFLTAVCGMLRPGDLAIDCGANVGDISARLLASGADVIAFDPEPFAVEKLRQRFADEARFQLIGAAVGTCKGTVHLMRASNFDDNAALGSVKSTVVTGGRMIDEKTKGRGYRHRRTVVSPHAIDGDSGCHGKRKGRQSETNYLPFE